MKKKLVLNICMVLTVLLVTVCGIMTVGSIMGWFDGGTEEELPMTVSEKNGIAMIERSGIAYELSTGTAIRPEDKLYTKTNASVTIAESKKNCIYLGSNAEMSFTELQNEWKAEVLKGEALVDGRGLENAMVISGDMQILLSDAVATVSTQAGVSMVYVYAGTVSLSKSGTEEVLIATSGEVVTIVETSEEYAKATLQATSLNDLQMQLLVKCGMDESFCFTEAELKAVQKQREEEILKAQQEALEMAAKEAEEISKKLAVDNQSTLAVIDGAEQDGTETSILDENGETETSYIDSTESSSGDDSGDSENVASTPQQSQMSCTIEIRCDTILNNMENLTAGKEGYVPSSGTILGTTKASFTEGETVFEVLKRVCSSAGIQLEYSWTPLYDSYYIEGINYLYEFDCGSESGWMYKVNGWFPNYGCSSYTLEDGDTIVWCYTCNGLGADVGGPIY